MVEHSLWERDVAGSNPVIPTLGIKDMIHTDVKDVSKINRFSPRGGYLAETIPDEIYDILISESEKAKNNELLMTDKLIGNLEESYDLMGMPFYKFEKFERYMVHLCSEYEQEFNLMKMYPIISSSKSLSLSLKMLWVNYQKKYEFNPVHNHTGLYSFVVWLKIPYSCREDEFQVKRGNPKEKYPGTFNFFFPNGVGDIEEDTIELDSSWEKTILVFPSTLKHCVYPFYTSDEYRISVSGNFYLDVQNGYETY